MNASGEWDINSAYLSLCRVGMTVVLFSDERNQSSSRVRYIVIVSLNMTSPSDHRRPEHCIKMKTKIKVNAWLFTSIPASFLSLPLYKY